MKQLSSVYPSTIWPHLKRVRSHETELSIIICPFDELKNAMLSKESLFSGMDICTEALGDPQVVMVPSSPALTRDQFNDASIHWPLSFHEDKRISRLMSETIFSSDEMARLREFMFAAVILAV